MNKEQIAILKCLCLSESFIENEKVFKMKEIKIDLENGKYTFIINNVGEVFCLRFGEPWMEFERGGKAIISLIHKALENKEDSLDNLKNFKKSFLRGKKEGGD